MLCMPPALFGNNKRANALLLFYEVPAKIIPENI